MLKQLLLKTVVICGCFLMCKQLCKLRGNQMICKYNKILLVDENVDD